MPLRVISGTAGGLLLKSPKRHALRPTQDRIRGVIFSSLAEIPGARVLDLYAGTGSFGIEALSRGAERVVFVEQDREAIECIRENLRHCKLTGGDVRQSDALAYLDQPGECFDLIFADPPYDKKPGPLNGHPLLAKFAQRLCPKGLIVWEHFASQQIDEAPEWSILRHRTYGETGLTFFRPNSEKKV